MKKIKLNVQILRITTVLLAVVILVKPVLAEHWIQIDDVPEGNQYVDLDSFQRNKNHVYYKQKIVNTERKVVNGKSVSYVVLYKIIDCQRKFFRTAASIGYDSSDSPIYGESYPEVFFKSLNISQHPVEAKLLKLACRTIFLHEKYENDPKY